MCACACEREEGGEGQSKENWWERMRLSLGPCSFGFVLNFPSLRMGVILLQAEGLLEVRRWLSARDQQLAEQTVFVPGHRVGPQQFVYLVQEKVGWAESGPSTPHHHVHPLRLQAVCSSALWKWLPALRVGSGEPTALLTCGSPAVLAESLEERGSNNNQCSLGWSFCKALLLELFNVLLTSTLWG